MWLYRPSRELLSATANEILTDHDLRISPIIELELALMAEIGRIQVSPSMVIRSLESSIGLSVCDLDFRQVVDAAIGCDWTRDPFDRLIVGHARTGQGLLLTRDELIRRHVPEAVW